MFNNLKISQKGSEDVLHNAFLGFYMHKPVREGLLFKQELEY